MRLLTFTSLFPNRAQPLLGMFNYHRLTHFVRKGGNEATVVAPVPYWPTWLPARRWGVFSQIPAEEEVAGIAVHHPRYFLVPRVSMPLHGWLMQRGSAGCVERLQGKRGFDCIDAQYVYPEGFAAVRLGRRLGLPVMVTALGTDINVFSTLAAIRPLLQWTLNHAAGVVAVAASLKEGMLRLGVPAERIEVIPNGVDTERFHPVEQKAARRRLAIPEGVPVVVAAGALVPSKGFQLLVEAVGRLTPRHPTLRAYIAGEGPMRAALKEQIRGAGLAERVRLVGSQPNQELKYWFSAADLSCLPSAREGQPNVVLESLACGTPVVATRVGGIPELVVSLELGVLVEQDVAALTSALELALGKRWDRVAIAAHAARRTWGDVAEEVEKYFRSRINSWRPAQE